MARWSNALLLVLTLVVGTLPIALARGDVQRKHGPRFVRWLTALLAASPESGAGRIPPETLLELNQFYGSEYAHGAPFDPGALLQFWERCGLDERSLTNCRSGLLAAERLALGDTMR